MTGTAEQIAQLMIERRNLVDKEFRQSSRGIAISALKFAKEKITEGIYAIPEDRTRAGKKKWKRTGALRRAERYEIPDPYTVMIINDVAYAEPRHEAGKPGRRGINPERESHWRDELAAVFGPIVLDVRHQTIIDVLKAAGRSGSTG